MNHFHNFADCWAWAIGDGVCDDANNVEPCDFDGLDCCGEISSYQFNFCVFCNCHLKTWFMKFTKCNYVLPQTQKLINLIENS